MLNDFIGGGQVFLHKLRMLLQVLRSSFTSSLLVSVAIVCVISYKPAQLLDLRAAMTYQKALLADSFDDAGSFIRNAINPNAKNYYTKIDAYDKKGLYAKDIDPRKILKSRFYRASYLSVWEFVKIRLALTVLVMFGIFVLIYLLWSRFGKDVKAEKQKDGSNKILTSKEVRKCLRKIGKASDLTIGDMPLVKDMETMNLLVSGSIGSGKTNLMHNLLPQVESRGEAAIIIDNTGGMIAKYYDPSRGDIIFNPLDNRSHYWDFWHDCAGKKDLEKFADILMGFNSRKNNRGANDFWEESAASIFVACTEVLQQHQQYSIIKLYKMLCQTETGEMYTILKGTDAAKYFTKDNAKTASSIMSVLMANIKPLRFLTDNNKMGAFSIEDYINKINSGSGNWLFLATDPSARELTIPLNASLLELLISRMRRSRINARHKLWIVMDELPSLGKLPGLPQLMQEGRKYGTCVLSGLQSTSQLYQYYGNADASNLIGLFKTKFAFASDDPRMGELYSKLCGSVTTISQQKNTSFGANEFRDGVSYNERHEKSPLVSYEDFSCLSIGQCYVILPEISARLAKIQVPQATAADKNKWFVEVVAESKMVDKIHQQCNNLDSDNIATNNDESEFNTEIKNDEFILNR